MELPSLIFKSEQIFLCADVSRYLGRANYYVNTKISRGDLERETHYIELSPQEVTKLMENNKTFIWGRGRLKYFVTKKGLDYLSDNYKLQAQSLYKRAGTEENRIKIKTGNGPRMSLEERNSIIEDLETSLLSNNPKQMADSIEMAIDYLKK